LKEDSHGNWTLANGDLFLAHRLHSQPTMNLDMCHSMAGHLGLLREQLVEMGCTS
jgi:hypothetical protein